MFKFTILSVKAGIGKSIKAVFCVIFSWTFSSPHIHFSHCKLIWQVPGRASATLRFSGISKNANLGSLLLVQVFQPGWSSKATWDNIKSKNKGAPVTNPKWRKQTVLEELKWDFFTPNVEGCKQSAVGTTGAALNQGGGEEGRGREMRGVSFKRAAGERVGMALDKLPDPLPLRHSKQWGGRAICRQWDTYISLHPFLLDEVTAALIRIAPSLRPPACRGLCPELTAAWAQCNTPALKSQPWENNPAKTLPATWHKEPSPPSAGSHSSAVPVYGPACSLFRSARTGCYSSLYTGFVCLFLIFMSQNLDPRQDYRGK